MQEKNIFESAIKKTEIIRLPKRNIATFGITRIDYHIVTSLDEKTFVREGIVVSQRPEIIKPTDLKELFEGFGENIEDHVDELFEMTGHNIHMLNYRFKNEVSSKQETSLSIKEVINNIDNEIEKGDNSFSALIKAEEETWQFSVMKLIVDITLRSANDNIKDLNDRAMFLDSKGVPQNIRNRIEYLFREAGNSKSKREELGRLLTKHSLLAEYEDRYFSLFTER